jgi:hypothetical protein
MSDTSLTRSPVSRFTTKSLEKNTVPIRLNTSGRWRFNQASRVGVWDGQGRWRAMGYVRSPTPADAHSSTRPVARVSSDWMPMSGSPSRSSA